MRRTLLTSLLGLFILSSGLAEDRPVAPKGGIQALLVWTDRAEGCPEIRRLFKAGAAQKAGLKVGDIVTHLDSLPLKNIKPKDTTEKFLGDPGSQITLTVRRQGSEEPLTVKVIRQAFPRDIWEQ